MFWDLLLMIYLMAYLGWSAAGVKDDVDSAYPWAYVALDGVTSLLAAGGIVLFLQDWSVPGWEAAFAFILAGEATMLWKDYESSSGDGSPVAWIALTLLFLLPALGVNLTLALR